MKLFLAALMQACLIFGLSTSYFIGKDDDSSPFLPPSSMEKTVEVLPFVAQPILLWARVTSAALPNTTASMMELDYVHRTQNPLGNLFAAEIRLVVAECMKSPYGMKLAKYDMQNTCKSEGSNSTTAVGVAELRFAIAERFARQLTLAANEISDAEFNHVLQTLGLEDTVALVHTVAYANFQNRMFLAMGLRDEDNDDFVGVPVIDKRDNVASVQAPDRPAWDSILAKPLGVNILIRPDWQTRDFAEIEAAMEAQKSRAARIPLPPKERFENLPAEIKQQAEHVAWTNVSMGYQPQLTGAWFDSMMTCKQETNFDRVFSNSIFWVITRANDCFY